LLVDLLMDFVCQAYLRVQLGTSAFDGAYYNEAVDHFTAAINSNALLFDQTIHLKYEIFVLVS